MKKNLYLLLIILGVTAFIFGVFLYNKTEPFVTTKVINASVNDVIHDSNGSVNLSVEYPAELTPGENGTVTLKASPDSKVQKILDKNLTIDAYMATLRMTSAADRRQTTALLAKDTQINWDISSKVVVDGKARVSVGLSDARSNPELYPLAPQHHFELTIPVVEKKSQPNLMHYLHFVLMGIGVVLLVVGFVQASRDFDAHIKESRKRK